MTRYHILPRTALAGALAISLQTVTTHAQYYPGTVYGAAESEIARRQSNVIQAENLLASAREARDRKDYEAAWKDYQTAYSLVPESVATGSTFRKALQGYGEVSVLFAEQRIAEGRRQDAENILKIYLRANPEYRPALNTLAHLEAPDYYNPTITPGFIDKVEQVKQWHREAKGYMDRGSYDLAEKRYQQILNLDKYNEAARRGMEEVDFKRNKYAETAYDQTRAELLWRVEKQWELPVRRFDKIDAGPLTDIPRDAAGTEKIRHKLATIRLPKVSFSNTTVREAIDFLKTQSERLDPEQGPDKGVNIVLSLAATPAATGIPGIPGADPAGAPPVGGTASDQSRITLNLSNVPLQEALKYVTDLAGLKYKVDPYAVSVVPLSAQTDNLITKEYRVAPGVIDTSVAAPAGGGAAPSPFGAAGDAKGTGAAIVAGGGSTARDFLEARGVTFPPESSAIYLPRGSRLIVRNTQSNLDLIDAIVEQDTNTATQVEIESKFLEVTQTNLKELGFDWLLGPFNVGTSERVFAAGGTAGSGTPVASTNYPFNVPGLGGGPVGTNPITAGNRSGNIAIQQNAIDALIHSVAPGAGNVAPAILGLAGVFTDPQFQVVIRALNQQTGVDLMSAPRVIAKAGDRAVIEIIREFRYPTEFEPPEIPQDFGGQNTGGGGGGVNIINLQPPVFPVTPTTPTSFETRNVGVTMEVSPQVGADGYTIDLEVVPTVTEFEGFINYGSPIQTVSVNALGISQTNVLTENVINQPIFSTRKVQTKVSIWDGSTVVLGGLMREDVQRVQDKVPGLGDIPFAGRLFRSESDQHVKRNLVIFVTARLLDPAGQPIKSDEEEEEVVESLIGPDAPVGPSPGFAK